MSKREPMSSVDRAWLLMDRPTNRMVINGFWIFQEPIEYERVVATLEERLLIHDRFRQRVVEVTGPTGVQAYWEEDPYFDMEAHVRRVALPPPGDMETLRAFISTLASDPLDRERPLWQFYLIENYLDGNVLMARIHHAVGDGAALVHVLLSLADSSPEGTWKPPRRRRVRDRGHPLARWVRGTARTALDVLETAVDLSAALVNQGLEVLSRPGHVLELLDQGGRVTGSVAEVLAKLALMPPDSPSVFKGKLGVAKRVAWSDPIPLDDVKTVKRLLGATVNDVLVAALTGALRRYMMARGDDPEGKEVRAMVPVNVRPKDAPVAMGNQFALVYLGLPVGIQDPLVRLFEVKRRMDHIKASPEALITFQIIRALGRAPGELAGPLIEYFASKASAVLTNVPGPPQKLYFAGRRFDTLVFWVPQSGNIGLGLSIFSYGGDVTVGVMSDANLVPDPENVVQAYHQEFDELLALAQLPHMVEAARRQRETAGVQAPDRDGQPSQEAPTGSEEGAPSPISTAEITVSEANRMADALLQEFLSLKEDPEPDRCRATTRSGRRCRRRRKPGSPFCAVHQIRAGHSG